MIQTVCVTAMYEKLASFTTGQAFIKINMNNNKLRLTNWQACKIYCIYENSNGRK